MPVLLAQVSGDLQQSPEMARVSLCNRGLNRLYWPCLWAYSPPVAVRCGVFHAVNSGEQAMKRKPDLVMALVLAFGIGVVVTGYAQALTGG